MNGISTIARSYGATLLARVLENGASEPGVIAGLHDEGLVDAKARNEKDGGREAHVAAKGGEDRFETSRNFLATDRVPDTIFGIPVVSRREDYAEKDLEFFKKHPEAGGYYDLGDEDVDDGTEEGAPVQDDEPKRGRYPGISNNPGNVEKHELRKDKTLFDGEIAGGKRPKRFAIFDDPVKGLRASAVVLARKANALAKAGKKFTIENYAPLYAPPKENDTEAYIKNLSAYSGIPRGAELDRWDAESLAKLLKAKVRFETDPVASEWFTDDEYREAAELVQEGVFD